MKQISDRLGLREVLAAARCNGESIGLVPTMGYLHAGHLELAKWARTENTLSVMSIYVNPSQFGPGEDLDRYPRDLARDLTLAESVDVDVLFTPNDATMYPDGVTAQEVWVEPGRLGQYLEGAARPTHFRGVATLVAKLFQMVGPDRAYFGQKDAQQAAIVTRMARDLAQEVEIRIIPTVRESDGLAVSSRNVFLSTDDRKEAAGLNKALNMAAEAFRSGNRDAASLESIVRKVLARLSPNGRVDYVTVASLESMEPLRGEVEVPAIMALAVFLGATRLIDNMVFQAQAPKQDHMPSGRTHARRSTRSPTLDGPDSSKGGRP